MTPNGGSEKDCPTPLSKGQEVEPGPLCPATNTPISDIASIEENGRIDRSAKYQSEARPGGYSGPGPFGVGRRTGTGLRKLIDDLIRSSPRGTIGGQRLGNFGAFGHTEHPGAHPKRPEPLAFAEYSRARGDPDAGGGLLRPRRDTHLGHVERDWHVERGGDLRGDRFLSGFYGVVQQPLLTSAARQQSPRRGHRFVPHHRAGVRPPGFQLRQLE